MGIQTKLGHNQQTKTVYLSLIKNRTLMLLWIGKFISIIGDNFFDLAVMWVVYEQSQSVLQSALVGVVFHLSSALMSPIAGGVADRWNRKTIMWSTNLLAALVVSIVALVMFFYGHLPLILALLAILLLNVMTSFLNPAEASVMPEIVGKDQLGTANGLFSTIGQIGHLLGQAAAGILIASLGAVWALTGNSLSFLIVTGCILAARIPQRKISHEKDDKQESFWVDLKKGWSYTRKYPVLKGILWLTLFINLASFIGPLLPAYIAEQLNEGAAAFGILMVCSAVGGMIGGLCIGVLERRCQSGFILIVSLVTAGFSLIGMSLITSIPLAMGFFIIFSFCITIASVIIMTAQMNLVSEEYRGRVFGIMKSFAVLAIPMSTLLAGFLGDIIGVSILFTFAGVLVICFSTYAWVNPHLRNLDTKGKQFQGGMS